MFDESTSLTEAMLAVFATCSGGKCYGCPNGKICPDRENLSGLAPPSQAENKKVVQMTLLQKKGSLCNLNPCRLLVKTHPWSRFSESEGRECA